MSAIFARFQRARRVGPRVLAHKVRIRCWSSRVSITLSRAVEPGDGARSDMPLAFSVIAPNDLDVRELALDNLRGADLLYVEGILKVHRMCPGDLIVARNPAGALVAVGLLSYADRHHELDLAAPGLYPKLSPDECWTEAYFVVPEYRNKGVMASTLAATRKLLAGKGIQRMHAVITSDNLPSLRAFARAGYEPTGTIRHERFRFNRFSSWFAEIDDETQEQWDRITSGAR